MSDTNSAKKDEEIKENIPEKDFSNLDNEKKIAEKKINSNDIRSLDFILDIPLKVSVEVGHTKILVRDLLQLGQGSVVELTKFAGEPLEMLVNDKLIARGEVVVVNEKFGLRLTDIISPEDRVEQLR